MAKEHTQTHSRFLFQATVRWQKTYKILPFLTFVILVDTSRICLIPNFTTKNNKKAPKKISLKLQNMHIFAFNLEKLTPARKNYTGTARCARDKYEVWVLL